MIPYYQPPPYDPDWEARMSNWNFEEILKDLDDDDIAERLKDTATTILAGFDQARTELDMPWQAVSWKRMKELSERIAVETVDWSAAEGLLVGTWMAATSRTQLLQDQES